MINYKMMEKSNVLSRCLQGGPVPIHNMDAQIPVFMQNYPIDKSEITISEGTVKKLLKTICDLYESCAILAYDEDKIVGLLRFYPKIVFDILENITGFRLESLCIQQGRSMKTVLHSLDLLPKKEFLTEKTIEIQCFHLVTHYHKGAGRDYGGQGIAYNMLKKLIEWAQNHDWDRIVSNAITHIKPLLLWVGGYSIERFKDLGFSIIDESISNEIKDGVISQRQGKHGTKIQEMWDEYQDISDDEAARVYKVALNLN